MTHSFRQAIEETLPWLSSFGADPTGGLTRLLYSPEWLQAQQAFKQKMSDSGLETRFDEVGNLYGRLPGSRFPDDVILSGSHIDSVVNGGNLDRFITQGRIWISMRKTARSTGSKSLMRFMTIWFQTLYITALMKPIPLLLNKISNRSYV